MFWQCGTSACLRHTAGYPLCNLLLRRFPGPQIPCSGTRKKSVPRGGIGCHPRPERRPETHRPVFRCLPERRSAAGRQPKNPLFHRKLSGLAGFSDFIWQGEAMEGRICSIIGIQINSDRRHRRQSPRRSDRLPLHLPCGRDGSSIWSGRATPLSERAERGGAVPCRRPDRTPSAGQPDGAAGSAAPGQGNQTSVFRSSAARRTPASGVSLLQTGSCSRQGSSIPRICPRTISQKDQRRKEGNAWTAPTVIPA